MINRPHVLIVRNAYEQDFGGGERYPVNLAKELIKNGLQVVVASAHTKILALADDSGIAKAGMPWLSSQNFSGLRILLFPLYILWQIRLMTWYLKFLKKHDIDVAHVQSRDDFIGATIAARILKKKVIWTDHADLKYVFKNIGVIYKNPVGKLVYFMSKYATKIIVVSKNELSLINESLLPRKLTNSKLIYNGVTDIRISPKRDLDTNTTIFALTSRLVDSKGIREVIDASKLLDEEGYKHRVILLGEGPQEEGLKKRAGRSVIFMGFPDDALSFVAGADVFVHPSYNEAFSLSLVEAAMLGKPTIATEIGGNPEIIEHKKTGVLIKPNDVDSLYIAMKEAIANPELFKGYGQALRKCYEEKFQLDKIVRDRIIPLYNSK